VHDHATPRPVYRPTAVKGTSSPIPPAPPRCPPTLRWRVAYQHCLTHSTPAPGGRLRCAEAYKPHSLNPAHSSLPTPPSTNRSRIGIRASTTTRAARRRRPCDTGRGRPPPRFACSARFERATPSVSATAFIGNRPDRATANATAVFLPARRLAPSFRISTSRVLRPKRRSSSRIRSSSWRTLAAAITSSSTRTASRPPSAIRLQLNKRLGERSCLRATNETDVPDCRVMLAEPRL
jgi:hypothetical protein